MNRDDLVHIQITASFTAEPLEELIAFWLQTLGLNARCGFSGYRQVFQEALDPQSVSGRNENGVNVFLLQSDTVDAGEFERALRTLADNASAPAIVVLCPSPNSRSTQVAEDVLVDRLKKIRNVQVVGSRDLLRRYPVDEVFDTIAQEAGDIPYTDSAFAAIATAVVRGISAVKRRPYKVIVLDCDNTLWNGIVGEDGVDGITITDGHRALQNFMLQQRDQGMLLCLCSKNNREDVEHVFDDRADMLLRPGHIVASEINWDPKSENIRRLARQLNLGLDSFVFLDDNPAEVAEVALNCPQVAALELPKDPRDFPDYLEHVWAFDSKGTTSEDAARSDFYQQEYARNAAIEESSSFIDFLRSLGLWTEIHPPADEDFTRISQLTARTNQFNANPVPRSEAELRRHLQENDSTCLTVRASDRFGDYGLVGAVTYRCNAELLVADTFLLSCRALGKGVDRAMIIELGKVALACDATTIDIIFTPTKRNHPCRDFLESIAQVHKSSDARAPLRYRIPARDAAALSPLPERPHSNGAPKSGADKQSESRGAFAGDLAQRIATVLRRPADVVACIRSRPQARPDLRRPFVALKTDVEQKLAAIWSDVLGIDGIGRYDGFAELGGNSLAATRVLSRVWDAFGVKLPLDAIFESPILADLAVKLSNGATADDAAATVHLPTVIKAETSPVPSPSQKRMWFLDRFTPGMTAYNIPACFRLDGPLNRAALQRALDTVASRHEAFHCTFPDSHGEAVVHVADQPALPLVSVDLTDVAPESRLEKATAFANSEACQQFDLENGPLARAGLVRLSETDHLFTFTIHHIIADGWSMSVFFGELTDAYRHLTASREPQSAPLGIQYSDFAKWQIARLNERAYDNQLAYWKETLAGAPAVLDLPTDHPRPPGLTYRGGAARAHLEVELVEKLETLSREQDASLFMVLLAGFQTLLRRYTDQADIVVGTPVAGRTRPELEALLGCFVNTLVLRTDLSGDPSFEELLVRVRRCTLDALAYQDLPFDRLVDELDLPRDLSHSPLFQVMFVLQNTPGGDFQLSGLSSQAYPVHNGGAKFDLLLELTQRDDGIDVVLEYNRDLFEHATASRLLGHLTELLVGIAENPTLPVFTLPITAEAEREDLLINWNQTQREYPTDVCLHELFEQQVERSPDAVALIYDGQELTYSQLNARANQLAHFLRDQGVQPDTRVGVFMHRGLDMVISLYAILKAGGAYVPLDPDYPCERLAFMLQDSSCDLLLIQKDLEGAVPVKNCVRTIAVDDQWSMIARCSAQDPSRAAGPNNLAYVIYTSGSTGKPKGVMNEHAGICNRLFWMQEAFDLSDDDRVLQKTPFSFDVSVWEFFWPLLFGAKLVIARPDGHRDPDYLVRLIEKHNVTTMHFVPSMLQAFLRADDVAACSCLRRVICSGEALGYDLQEMFFQRLDAELHNLYGPTEAAVDVTHWACRRSDERHIVPIGKPIANTQIYVLDAALNPVPVGMVGELHIGGVQVARGYMNREELTAEKFIGDPFAESPLARLYKTGDLARFLPDGNVEYLGRIDHQVKIRGFRIELGEIESELCEHTAVDEAIVLAREDNPGENRLVAYLVCDQSRPSISQLRDYLKAKLPEYMVPAALVYLDKFPLTNSGKVDRKVLPPPDDQRPELADRFVAPRTEVEEKLAVIWRDVLRIEQIGVHDNYFELGGDSIQSTLVISAARKMGLKLTPRQLFESPTIAQLAIVADQTTDLIPRDQGPIKGESPLTPIQHQFFEQHLADFHHYNQAFLFNVRQSLDESALRSAMVAAEDHHDALRLRFRCESGIWHQEFAAHQTRDVPLEYVDLSAVSDAQIESEITRTATRFQSSLDIRNGPLWRVLVIQLANGGCRLLMIVHHLVIDGVSWRILLEDLEQGYHQATKGDEITLSAKTTSFKVWAEHLQQFAVSQRLAGELSHWNQVAKLKHASVPTDAPTASDALIENTVATIRKVTLSLTEEESQDLLQRVPQAYNTMINDVLLTALANSIQSWTGNRQVLVDLEGHGREDLFEGVDLSRTLGWFTTIYPVRLELPDSSLPQDALKAIKEQLRSVPQRGIGYGVLRYLGKDVQRDTNSSTMRELSSLHDPEILFNYFGKFDDVVRDSQLFEFATEGSGAWCSGQQRRRHALEINCMVIRDRLEIEWTYSSALHQDETIEAIATEFLRSLRELIGHCVRDDVGGRTPSDFPLCGLDQAALDRVVDGSSDIEDIYPPSPIQLLFLARAASDSGAILDHWQCTLAGKLDVEAFQRAWQDVFDCHPVLRTSVRSEGLSEPLQVIERQIRAPWTIDDWSLRPADQHQELWQQMLKEDSAIGMKLDQAPLSRFTLVRLAEDKHRFLWSVPSLLLDGWSWPLVFADVSKAYQGHIQNENVVLERTRTYRDYLEWLQDHATSFDQGVVGSDGNLDVSEREFWQANLDGISEPTPLLSESPPVLKSDSTAGSDPFERVSCTLDNETIDQLGKTIRTRRTTMGALVQAAWSVVLSRLSSRQDVIFGAAFSGRPTDLAGAESMVGPFTNNLPVRVQLTGDESLGDLLRAAHDRLLRLNPYQFVPSAQIQSWSNVPWQHRLFNSLVVVQNYVVQESARRMGTDVAIENFDGPIHTNFPLLVLVEPDSDWKISLIFDRRVIAPAAIERWRGDLIHVLRCVAEDLDASVGSVMENLSEPIKVEHAHRKFFVQSQNYVPPRTPTQKAIERVWSDTIQLDRISIDDNLFDLGVHSLLVVQLHKKLQDDLGKQIGLVTLFRYPTIFALAQHLDSGTQGSDRLKQSQNRGQRQRQMLASMKNVRSRIKR